MLIDHETETQQENKNMIRHAHDRVFKAAMQYPEVAKAFFQTTLPKELIEKINWNHFILQPGNHVDQRYKELIIDVLYLTQFQDETAYLYLLTNHQSTVDRWMAFHILQYTCNIIDQHLKKYKKVPFVFPLVVYHGKDKWDAPIDINELVDADPVLVNKYFLKSFQLIDLNKIPDATLKKEPWWGSLALALKYIYSQNMTPHLQEILDLLKLIQSQRNGKKYSASIISYIFDRGEIDPDVFLQQINEQLSPTLGENLMTGVERLVQRGMQQGMQQGMQANAKKVAKSMLVKSFEISLIAELTGLSLEEIILMRDAATH